MSFTKGFNFRSTAGFVSDAADDTYVFVTDAYPVTRNGVTFGWTVTPSEDRDRNSSIDARLAGIVFVTPSNQAIFRVDLPSAGNYAVRLAIGDASFANGVNDTVVVIDDSTYVIALTSMTPGAEEFYDATNVKRTSAADWVSNNASSTQPFASTILNVALNPGGLIPSATPIAHLSVSEVTAPQRRFLLTRF